ncbi:helix-turn-helix domain-containing protein, partial [Nocardia sp. NPDC003672]
SFTGPAAARAAVDVLVTLPPALSVQVGEVVAPLIGRGLSNRAIAERLCVSVRTVEGHIYRACIKLDATDRDQLAKLI